MLLGRNFGAYVTHEVGRYIYFYIGQKGFLIWSTVNYLNFYFPLLAKLMTDQLTLLQYCYLLKKFLKAYSIINDL